MKPKDHPYFPKFVEIYYSKNASAQFLQMVFKPEKYKEFHDYLTCVHEDWIDNMNEGYAETFPPPPEDKRKK